jgi:hypoxanthine phosphoribosyltransferase
MVLLLLRYLAWGHVNDALRRLVKKLEALPDIKEYQRIYAVGRGGFVPTRLLSGKTKIKNVGFIDPDDPMPSLKGNYGIICDDIFDTGKTYHKVVSKVPKSMIFAFLYMRQTDLNDLKHNPKNVVYGMGIHSKDYLVFPWEEDETD